MAITINAGVTLNHGLTFSANGGGGGGGGGPNTYTRNVNYTSDQSAYVSNYSTLKLAIQEGTWNNPSEFLTARSYTSGTSVTITVSGESPFTTTLTSNFVEDNMLPGQWLATIQQAGGMFPYPTGTITTFTIG